jgi:hypothetical protein
MVVNTLDGMPKTRRFERLSVVCQGGEWGVHNHNRTNVVRGLVERVYSVERKGELVRPPQPLKHKFKELSSFRAGLLRHLDLCRRWTNQEFLDSYHGAKKLLYERAFDSLTLRPLLRQDGYLQTFVKAEKLNFSSKPDPAPRVIQPRSTRYNCVVGPYLKPLEKRIYHAIDKVFGGPTVMKGLDAYKQGAVLHSKWRRFHDPVAIGLDASRFDQHVSTDALKWEHSVYNACYRSKTLSKLLTWQLENVGYARTPDGFVKYKVNGCRMSGDMNTAMGNVLIMCALVWQFLSDVHVDGELVNNGDDCVIIVERGDVSKIRGTVEKWFLGYGFTMKVEEDVDVFEKIVFCQMQPVFDGSDWRMVRNPRITFDKDGINLKPGNQRFEDWLHTVGECGLALTSGLPVVQAYYQYLMSMGTLSHMETSGMKYLRGNLESKARHITTQARVSFWRAFDIHPYQQECIESCLAMYSGCGSDLMTREIVSSINFQF